MAQETWQDRAERRIKELGLARADLLKPLGVQTVGAVSHYFNGRRDPTPAQLIALARELKMTLDELLLVKPAPLEHHGNQLAQATRVEIVGDDVVGRAGVDGPTGEGLVAGLGRAGRGVRQERR